MQALSEMGVGQLFGPGTATGEIIEYIENWVDERGAKVGVAS
jgi:methylmalonyl-CoA mutase cobalamin-binding subunit